MFRVTINDESINQNYQRLGDRVLSCWVGTPQGGIISAPTYSYTNLNGAGNANVVHNLEHKNRHLQWHFVYFAYSRKERKARLFIKFKDSDEEAIY